MIRYLEKDNFNEIIKEENILVDFYADWCGPCKMLGAELEKIDDINVLKVNVDLYADIAKKYGVMSIPTLIYFEKGKQKNKSIGFIPKEEIEKIAKKHNV